MEFEWFKYALMGLYVVVIYWLSYLGMRKTKDLAGYSIGNKDMSPILVGVAMASSIASTATFVINPGFVYVDGLSAYLHYAVAAFLGMLVALLTVTRGFLKIGDRMQALTIPDWIRKRYGSAALALFFAGINLLSVTFVVLILVGCAILVSSLFPVSQTTALVLVLLFTFSYVLMGGSYAHAYTNAFQGILMAVISLFLFGWGMTRMDGSLLSNLQAVSVDYASVWNPSSALYYDFFSVFVSGFVITFALMMQPHILTKVLYLKSDKDVRRFLVTTVVTGAAFSLMLFVGFFARFEGLDVARQDAVVATYITSQFSGTAWGTLVLSFISITLLAAGMSTLDGILVALSAMVVNDIYKPLAGGSGGDGARGLALSRYVLVGIGLFALALSLDPPQMVGIFAQKGVYGLAAAAVVPIVMGVMVQGAIPVAVVATSAAIGLFGHLGLNLFGGVVNPSVSACYAILASFLFFALWLAFRSAAPAPEPEPELSGC